MLNIRFEYCFSTCLSHYDKRNLDLFELQACLRVLNRIPQRPVTLSRFSLRVWSGWYLADTEK